MENQFWAVGCWPGLDCGIKGFGPLMSNFLSVFFQFFMGKFFIHCSVRTEKSQKLNKVEISSKKIIFDPENMKKSFLYRLIIPW